MFETDDRGVSEVLGFTLVFALILAMVAFVSVVGFGDLDDARQFEQTNNAERAFDVLADNMDDVLLRGAPSRATEVKLTDSTVYFTDQVSINVTGTDASGNDFAREYSYEPLVYEGESGTRIIYSAGAVFRAQREGGRVVRDPSFVLERDRVHIPMAVTQSRESTSIGGSTVRIRAQAALRNLDLHETGGVSDVTINVTSPRRNLWRAYFERQPAVDSCTIDDDSGSVLCDLEDPERLSIQEVRMTMSFER
jgi:FlaG/FlaF family flagellin (archaellin)